MTDAVIKLSLRDDDGGIVTASVIPHTRPPSTRFISGCCCLSVGATEVIDSSNSGRAIKAFGCTRGTQGGAATSSDHQTLQQTTTNYKGPKSPTTNQRLPSLSANHKLTAHRRPISPLPDYLVRVVLKSADLKPHVPGNREEEK